MTGTGENIGRNVLLVMIDLWTGLMWAVWAWEEGGGELDCWERQLLKGYICNRESGKRL